MSTGVLFPSLSEDGWVDTSMKTADYLLSHFFLSDYSQTYIYLGNVSSLPYILQETQGDMPQTIAKVTEQLTNYFNRYFQNTEVEVTDATDPLTPSKAAISIYLKFIDHNNKEYVFGKLLEITEMTITKVIDINNG